MFIKYFNELWWIFVRVSITITAQLQEDQSGVGILSVVMVQGLYNFQTSSMRWIQGCKNKRWTSDKSKTDCCWGCNSNIYIVGKWLCWCIAYQITLLLLYFYGIMQWLVNLEEEFVWLVAAWIYKYINYISKICIPINGASWYTAYVAWIIEFPGWCLFHAGAATTSQN